MTAGRRPPDGPELRLVPADALAAAVADDLAAALAAAVAERGRAVLALSGGATPVPAFALLAADPRVDWSALDVVQVDERVAPVGHPDRNLTAIRRALVDDGPLPPGRLHPMPVEHADPVAAAAQYAALLGGLGVGAGPDTAGIDVVQLGLGPDGHTASLVPGDPVLDVTDRAVAATGPYQGRRRLTLTAPVLSAAGHVTWMVAGADRAGAVAALRTGTPPVPAQLVRAPRQVLVVDPAAVL